MINAGLGIAHSAPKPRPTSSYQQQHVHRCSRKVSYNVERNLATQKCTEAVTYLVGFSSGYAA